MMIPEPLVGTDVDLQDFAFMPLDVQRLRDSDLASDETPEACWAAVLIWCASWHQIPAASIPDNEQWIAKQAGYVSRGRIDAAWSDVRNGALRGWIKCSDGRLYHPVVAEKALAAWQSKLEQRWKTECSRIRKHNQRHGMSLPLIDFDRWISVGCPMGQLLPVPMDNTVGSQGQANSVQEDTSGMSHGQDIAVAKDTPPMSNESHTENDSKREGEVKGQGDREGEGEGERKEKKDKGRGVNGVAAGEPTAPPSDPPPDSTDTETALQVACRSTWDAYKAAYHERYAVDPVRNAKVNGQVKQFVKRIGYEESPFVAAFFVGHNNSFYVRKLHDWGSLVSDAEKLRTEWATGKIVTATSAQQADRTQANFTAANEALRILEANGATL